MWLMNNGYASYPVSPFVIDKIYSSRTDMDNKSNNDGVLLNRQACIKYCDSVFDQETRKNLHVNYIQAVMNGNTGEIEYYDKNEQYYNLPKDQQTYIDNYLKDRNNYPEAFGGAAADYFSYDQTVWVKNWIKITRLNNTFNDEGIIINDVEEISYQYKYVPISNLSISYAPASYIHTEGRGVGEAAGENGGEFFNMYDGENIAAGQYSHSEGKQTEAIGEYSHAQGYMTQALGAGAHAEGKNTMANGSATHSENYYNIALGAGSHAEGLSSWDYHKLKDELTQMKDYYNFSEGNVLDDRWGEMASLPGEFRDQDEYKAIEDLWMQGYEQQGKFNIAIGEGAHTEGTNNLAIGYGAHAEGQVCLAKGNGVHAEGLYTKIDSYGAHVEGWGSKVSGGFKGQHAEGYRTISSNDYAHSEGKETKASGAASHAEGDNTIAEGEASHAGGIRTKASGQAQTAIGKYNVDSEKALFIVGNGSDDNMRSNAFEVFEDGSAKIGAVGETDDAVVNKKYVETYCANNIENEVGQQLSQQNIAKIFSAPSQLGVTFQDLGWYKKNGVLYAAVKWSICDTFRALPKGASFQWTVRTTYGASEMDKLPEKVFDSATNTFRDMTDEEKTYTKNGHLVYFDDVSYYNTDSALQSSKYYNIFPTADNVDYGTMITIDKSDGARATVRYSSCAASLTSITLKEYVGMFTSAYVNSLSKIAWSGWHPVYSATIPPRGSGAQPTAGDYSGYVTDYTLTY